MFILIIWVSFSLINIFLLVPWYRYIVNKTHGTIVFDDSDIAILSMFSIIVAPIVSGILLLTIIGCYLYRILLIFTDKINTFYVNLWKNYNRRVNRSNFK